MKKYIIFAPIIAAGISLGSCSDFLDIEPQDEIVLENFWNEKSDVDNMIAGCYSMMQTEDFVTRLMIWGEVRSENIVSGNNVTSNTSLSNIFSENITQNNTYADWSDFYAVINACNLVIKYAPQVAESDPDYTESTLRANIAEVSAIRDLCYFYLIRTFRDVPFTTEAYVDDNQELAIPATEFDVVLDSLIEDLESIQDDAVEYYTETEPLYQTGRITQDAIHAMLCEMYLWKEDYEMCIWYADTVIGSKLKDYNEKYSEYGGVVQGTVDETINGFPLVSDANSTNTIYGSAFNDIFVDGNSDETIFELVFMDDDNLLSNAAVSYCYGNTDSDPGYFRPADFIATNIEDELYTIYINGYDTRSYENIRRYGDTDFRINKYATDGATLTVSTYTDPDDFTTSYGDTWRADYCHANWIIYRLTDVMLMKAEALTQLASDDEKDSYISQAFQIVDAVNTRSNCDRQGVNVLDSTEYTTKILMNNLVYEERHRELMFEGKRWYDLVRRSRREGDTDYLVEAVTEKYTTNMTAIQSKLSKMDAIYWPYTEDEMDVNPYLVQNSAYQSNESSELAY